MTQRRPWVTDHAVLRYLERVLGINVEEHRQAIEDKTSQAVNLGACAVVSDGFRYLLLDENVTSVVPAKSDPRLPRLKADRREVEE